MWRWRVLVMLAQAQAGEGSVLPEIEPEAPKLVLFAE